MSEIEEGVRTGSAVESEDFMPNSEIKEGEDQIHIRNLSKTYVTEDSDVGNAIGAITSSVSESVSFLLRPELAGEKDCKFEVFSKLGNFKYENLEEALAESERLGREEVIAAVESSGAEDVTVSVDRDDHMYAIGAGESSVLMEIRLTVTAAGKPRQFTSSK